MQTAFERKLDQEPFQRGPFLMLTDLVRFVEVILEPVILIFLA